MKLWFAISLALNFVLLGLFLFAARQNVPTIIAKVPVVSATTIPAHQKISGQKIAPAQAKKNDWHSWLDELRAAGVPNKVLAGLVTADFEDRWEDQQCELQRKYENGDLDADALTQADAQHDAEREKELRLALGEQGFRQWDKDKMFRDFNVAAANLSESDRDALYDLRKDLLKQRQDLQDSMRKGEIDEADMSEKLSAAQTQYEQQAKSQLGDERYAALTAAPDPAIANLKRQVKGLNLNADQMTALLQAQQQWNQQQAQLNDNKPGYEEQVQAADSARDAAFQTILGADGFAQFQKQQDASYQTLKHYASAWQLKDKDVNYLYGAIQNYKQSVQEYRDKAKALEAQGQAVDWDG
ncbi:MAG TPA: hypothetical protein VN516_05550, partial [Candidatus Baltobacteraceae bacterium]|nr:hypothetical protein [Candidatus Baltobacteraceae bacterium]